MFQREFQDSFKDVLVKFKGFFFKEGVKFQGCLKNVSMKFCFVIILLLHRFHCSYPRRRRGCFLDKMFKYTIVICF